MDAHKHTCTHISYSHGQEVVGSVSKSAVSFNRKVNSDFDYWANLKASTFPPKYILNEVYKFLGKRGIVNSKNRHF